jgi:hypothetical protein
MEVTTPFAQTGGVRVGAGTILAFNASWPFATIEVRENAIRISCLWMLWVFPRVSISRLQRHSGAACSGLRLEHTVTDYNQFIVFWSPNFDILAAALRVRGFAVG